MKRTRKLTLRREAGVDLTKFELNSIAGGATPSCVTWCASCVDSCPSIPLRNCTILQPEDTLVCDSDIC